jgi:hypothetical protein
MLRLAEYMADVAHLLGEVEHVHFTRFEAGSTVFVQHIEAEAAPKVQARMRSIARHEVPEDAIKIVKALNQRLAADNATGSLQESDGAEIIGFPGREQPQPRTFGTFNQASTLDGMLIRIGGNDNTVPVHLQHGDTVYVCNANRSMAQRLAPHLYGATLRVQGQARWERDAEGTWQLKRFNIADFDTLDDTPLGEVVERLRQVQGSYWKQIEDPASELEQLRQGGDGVH